MSTHNRLGLQVRLSRVIAVLVAILALQANDFSQTRVSRSIGMTLDQAMTVAVECVLKASGHKARSDIHKIRLYRGEDTLDFLGITDTTRLNALRRYLIRNEEIGTQRVTYTDQIDANHKRFYRYMITNHSLLGVKKDWTLLKLAQFIADGAGTPRMPVSTARKVLSDCRAYPSGQDPGDLASPKIKLALPIKTNLGTTTIADFAKCLVVVERYGLPSVKFDSPKGDALPFFIEIAGADSRPTDEDTRNRNTIAFFTAAINRDWTFDCLANFIAWNSQIALPSKTLAAEIAIASVLANIKINCPPGRAAPANGCVPETFFEDSALGNVLDPAADAQGRDGLARLRLDLKSNLDPSLLRSDASCTLPTGYENLYSAPRVERANSDQEFLKGLDNKANPRVVGDPFDFSNVTNKTTIRELIDIVREKLIW